MEMYGSHLADGSFVDATSSTAGMILSPRTCANINQSLKTSTALMTAVNLNNQFLSQ